jgi:hypothetical protein
VAFLLLILLVVVAAIAIVAIPFFTLVVLVNMIANRGTITIFKPRAAIKPKAKTFQKLRI